MAADAPTAFFSYSRVDLEFALRLAKDLKKAGANVWMDKLDVRPGQIWANKVEEALDNCRRVLVILSPSSVASPNVMAEVAFALDEGKEVIPVLYRECRVPFRLRPLQYVDFRSDYSQGVEELLGTVAEGQPPQAVLVPSPTSEQSPSIASEAEERERISLIFIYISYAGEDIGAARRLAADLRKIGADVLWFDKSDTKPGDVWDKELASAVQRCALFLPLISANTECRTEAYFRREWSEACQRSKMIAGRNFILPIVIDPDYAGNMDRYKLVPEEFKHFLYAPAGQMSDALRASLLQQLRNLRRSSHVDGSPAETARSEEESKDLTLRELRTLKGHTRSVRGLAISGDGCLAVSASNDQTLKVWDLTQWIELRTLLGHRGFVNAVALSGDGKIAVSACADKTLKVWDVGTGLELHTLRGHGREVNGVAVTPDGRLAISASADYTLKVWDLVHGMELRTLEGHSSYVNSAAVKENGRLAISASADYTLKVWDVPSGRELHTLQGHSSFANSVAVSGGARLAVSASEDDTLKVWDVASGRELRTLQGHSNSILGVAVSGDGWRAVSASTDHTLKFWDVKSGRELATFLADAELHCCAVSSDERIILAGDVDAVIHVLRFE